MRMLRPGERTAVHRHTASSICYVHRGEGVITAGAAEFAWEEGDCFTIPPWTWHHYENQSPHEPAFVFSVTDSPIFEALGLYRMQAAEG
jgi:gentisate 1,2-dioxygenase